MTPSTRRLLGVGFFFSGATSLLLEVAWSKELSYLLGNSLFAVSTVIAAFMAGLGLGSHIAGRLGSRIENSLLTYARLQVGIAVLGALSIPFFRALPPVFAALSDALAPNPPLFLLIRFVVVFLALLPAVVLMGMTLPVVVGATARADREDGREAGRFYGLNTMGAVAGTWAAAFVLIPALGLMRSTWVAAAIDISVAMLAFSLARSAGPRSAGPTLDTTSGVASEATPAKDGAPRPTSRQRLLLIVTALSGAVALALEVAWFRVLGLTFGPSVYAFSAMLGTYLLGVGFGSWLAGRWATSKRRGWGVILGLEAWIGLSALAVLPLLNALPDLYAGLFVQSSGLPGLAALAVPQIACSAVLLLAPCLAMGALFPFLVLAFQQSGDAAAPETHVGRLYLSNTFGGIVGSLAAGFLLIPSLGVISTLVLGSFLSLLLAAALAVSEFLDTRQTRAPILAAAGLVAGCLFFALAPDWEIGRSNLGLYRDLYAGQDKGESRSEQLIFHEEGLNTSVAVFRSLGTASLHVAGKPDASTGPGDVLTQSLLGHLPILFAQDPDDVLVVGYGSGMTAGAALAYPEVRSLDVLEIESGVIAASEFFHSINENPLDDPRCRLIVEDGRTQLRYSDKRYGVITSEPSNPWMSGVSNLFTREFYQSVREHLTPGGIFAQWVQNYDLSDEAVSVILATLVDVFPHAVVFQTNPWDYIILASEQALSLPEARTSKRLQSPSVQAWRSRIHWHEPEDLAFFLVAGETTTREVAASAPNLHTDDEPWLEHKAPLEMIRAKADSEVRTNLARTAAPRRLADLTQIFRGWDQLSLLRATAEYPFRWEPGQLQVGQYANPWSEITAIRTDAALRSLEREAPAERDSLSAWLERAEAADAARVQGARSLDGTPPGSNPDLAYQVLERAPELTQALFHVGVAEAMKGRPEAVGHLEQAAERRSGGFSYYALLALAELAARGGDPGRAHQFLEEAIAANPYYGNAFVAHAGLLMREGKAGEARTVAENGLRHNPNHGELEAILEDLSTMR